MISEYNAPKISESTLSSYLEFSLITLKNVTYHPKARNSSKTKSQRIEYCEYFVENSNSTFIYIDEVGYSIGVQRNRGRAPKGCQVIQKLPLQKTPNTSVCMAICNSEILYYKKKSSAYDGESFRIYLRELIQIIEERGLQNVILIMDNSSVHQRNVVEQECHGKVRYRFLPPYSPNLNPIENIFGIIKKYMKKILGTDLRDQLLHTFDLPWGSKTAARQAILDEAFVMSASQITQACIENSYNHMKKFIPQALEGKDI